MDIMKKDKLLNISILSILLFNIFFIIISIFYKEIIILVNRNLMNYTREYYEWLMTQRVNVKNEDIVVLLTYILQIIFTFIFFVEFYYIIINEKYKASSIKKNIIISIIIGFLVNLGIALLIKYNAEHYRLFMILIKTVISSIVLLYLIMRIRKMQSNK